ncbi:OJ1116_C07.14 [Oryza sativa Japonica Group]|uniref:OJ1116_C07.14 protein n=1 Tax=Oryza sativa subsp. japonica TaxID=39947 RepID=Q7F0T1_ORYSJ|nr:OJ1116_C07.14 [Oryza sativa Japonica Group]
MKYDYQKLVRHAGANVHHIGVASSPMSKASRRLKQEGRLNVREDTGKSTNYPPELSLLTELPHKPQNRTFLTPNYANRTNYPSRHNPRWFWSTWRTRGSPRRGRGAGGGPEYRTFSSFFCLRAVGLIARPEYQFIISLLNRAVQFLYWN